MYWILTEKNNKIVDQTVRKISSGDVIEPDRQIDFNRDPIDFELTFSIRIWSEILTRDKID